MQRLELLNCDFGHTALLPLLPGSHLSVAGEPLCCGTSSLLSRKSHRYAGQAMAVPSCSLALQYLIAFQGLKAPLSRDKCQLNACSLHAVGHGFWTGGGGDSLVI